MLPQWHFICYNLLRWCNDLSILYGNYYLFPKYQAMFPPNSLNVRV